MEDAANDTADAGDDDRDDDRDDDEPSPSRRRGRPRSTEVDAVVLAATLALAGEVGLMRMSMDEVAERAGVSKATIYRRWSTKEALVLAALNSGIGEIDVPDTGSLRSDLTYYLDELVDRFERGRMSDVLPHLIAVATHDDQVRVSLESYIQSRHVPVKRVFARAHERGELTGRLDDEILIDVLVGPLLHRRLLTGGALDHRVVEELLDIVLPAATGDD